MYYDWLEKQAWSLGQGGVSSRGFLGLGLASSSIQCPTPRLAVRQIDEMSEVLVAIDHIDRKCIEIRIG